MNELKLVSYVLDGRETLGVWLDSGIVAASELLQGRDGSITLDTVLQDAEVLQALQVAVQNAPRQHAVDASQVEFLPCVPRPGKVICIGLNYRKHAIETKAAIPTTPIVFSKFSDTVAAHGEDVPLPQGSSQVDYEAELAIVMGRKAQYVSEDDALDYVFGYCNANDLSARDLQMVTSQWLLGKTCPKFAPIGPYIATADEIEDPNNLAIKTYVNGTVRQNSNTGDMIFACGELISYLSQYMVLNPGDIILTGTPEGVILGLPKAERVWLKSGDTVTIEIEKLGQLTNKMV